MQHTARFIKIATERVFEHLRDGFSEDKTYEVLAVDSENDVFYVRNDNNEMIPIMATHCQQLHQEHYQNK